MVDKSLLRQLKGKIKTTKKLQPPKEEILCPYHRQKKIEKEEEEKSNDHIP